MFPPVNVTDLQGVSTVDELIQKFAVNQDVERWKGIALAYKASLGSFGRSLELILEEVDDAFEKAKALRKLAADAKNQAARTD